MREHPHVDRAAEGSGLPALRLAAPCIHPLRRQGCQNSRVQTCSVSRWQMSGTAPSTASALVESLGCADLLRCALGFLHLTPHIAVNRASSRNQGRKKLRQGRTLAASACIVHGHPPDALARVPSAFCLPEICPILHATCIPICVLPYPGSLDQNVCCDTASPLGVKSVHMLAWVPT